MGRRGRSERKLLSKSLPQQVFRCNICRNPFRSRKEFSSHCQETHLGVIPNADSLPVDDNQQLDDDEPKSKYRRCSGLSNPSSDPSADLQNVRVRVVDISPALRDYVVEKKEDSYLTENNAVPGTSVSTTNTRNTSPESTPPRSEFQEQGSDDDDNVHQGEMSPGSDEGAELSQQSSAPISPISSTSKKTKRKLEHVCPVPGCQKIFQTKNHKYTNHLEIHEGLKPFVCPYCEFGYEDDIKLMQHVTRQHTKESLFQCVECGKSYKIKRCLDVHLNRCHKIQP